MSTSRLAHCPVESPGARLCPVFAQRPGPWLAGSEDTCACAQCRCRRAGRTESRRGL